MVRLQVELLGGLRLRRHGGAELRVGSRKAQAVLACLALQPGTPLSRDFLATLLWEDSDPELARASLRQALTALRRALPDDLDDVLQGDAQTVLLSAGAVGSDVARMRTLLRDGSLDALAEVAERYGGHLLEGFAARSGAFEQWVDERRREVRREQLQGLERLAARSRAAGDATQLLLALERLTALEPTNERAQRELIEQLCVLGRYTDALRQYRLCRDALRRELDVAPEPATEALHRDVLKRRRAARPEDLVADEEPTVASPEAPASAASGVEPEPTATLRDAVVVIMRACSDEDPERHDPEAMRDRWSATERRLREIVAHHGGQATATGEREATALFGLSAATGHELQHALDAALALLISEPHAADPLAIGLARGQVLPAAREQPFPVTGRPVSLARTLATQARAGELLVSREVALEIEQSCELAEAAHAQTGSPGAARVLSQRGGPARGLMLAGRRAELALVSTLLERVVAGRRGRTVVVRGDPGIGKSTLLEALGGVAEAQGIGVHVVRVLDFGQTSRERPIPVIAAGLLGMSPGADDAMRRDAVARAVERGDLPVADVALAHDLLNVEPEADRPSPLATLDSPSRERGRQRVLHRLLECAASSSPRLLVVEDVHWADALEVAQLADLAAATANLPVLLAASTRADGDPISAAWRARARGCPVTTLDLAPFADDEAREYAARYAGLPPAVVERCLETSGGNPLFLQQLLRAAQLGQADLPGTVRGLLLARIERLDLATQRALHAAAVLGSRFPLDALRHVLGEPAFDVAALERSGMLTCGVHHDCQFAHALIRDAVYESLLRSVRRGWHQRAAQWYEIRDVGLQADHLAAAGDAAAAAVYLKAAAQERQACRFDQALHHALRARETAVHANELCDACAALGEVYLARGRTDDAIAAFRESIDLAASGGARARAWLGLAASLRIVDRYDEALAALDHAEQGAAADADPRVLAQLWTLRGNLHFPRGELDACMAAHERAREFAERAGSLDGIARALGGLGDAHYQRGKMRSARRLFAQCVALCEQHALGGLRLAYLPMVAVTAAYMGELAEADRIALAAARSSGDLGDPRSELLSTSIRANIALFGGRYADALAASARSGALAREIGAKRFEAEALILEGLALRGLGRLDEGYGLLERSAAVSREVCPTYCGPWAFAALALATTDANRARALIDEGERLLERGCVSHNHLDFRPAAIEVSLRDGDARAALHHADALERYTSEEPLAPASMYVERGRLLVALRSGTPVPALIDRISNTLQQFDSMGFVAASAGLRAAVDAAT